MVGMSRGQIRHGADFQDPVLVAVVAVFRDDSLARVVAHLARLLDHVVEDVILEFIGDKCVLQSLIVRVTVLDGALNHVIVGVILNERAISEGDHSMGTFDKCRICAVAPIGFMGI